MHVDIIRSTGLYRAGTTLELSEADAEVLIRQGNARPRRIEAPARNGTRDEWATYADKLNLDFPDDAGRDAIIAIVDAANPDGPPES